ncbi:MAG: 2-octaprenyl-6-methoxyphenyl hydroxylase, partial [Pseudohongiellaceae bacterium]
PVAGQGFNLALRDAEVLAVNVAQAINAGISPGTMAELQRFIRQQERDQHRTIDFSHYLTRIFSNERPSLVWTRKLGLAAIDLIPALKKEFARQAMGLADR